ncbi:hypothetical protein C2E23DRAFT_884762 [Lenzites betulinus]|nr:hypothetical protein C2E23DRAFT_884762 [Lenzites betulinus]
MSSSELSNALNPNSVVARPRRRHAHSSATVQSAATIHAVPQPSVPHRSELELAIAPPPEPPEPQTQVVTARPVAQQPPRNGNPVIDIFRVVATAREAAGVERQRRIAWEREQEAKAAQRQLEMEQQILNMRQELTLLKSYVGLHPNVPNSPMPHPPMSMDTIPTTAHIEAASPTNGSSPPIPLSPVSPIPYHPEVQHPMFIEGSSSRPIPSHSPALSALSPPPSSTPSPRFSSAGTTPGISFSELTESLAPSTPQSTSPSFTPAPPSPVPRPNARKRPRHVTEDASEPSESESEDISDEPSTARTRERRDRHKRHCVTIHHAMRIHIRKMMKIKHGEELPESHFEGPPPSADEPLRFVWGKTPRQSAHNAAMKKLVVSDLKANRDAYKHVADKEFTKKNLDSVFDQVFTTLRQNFKAQCDTTTATRLQRREGHKALKARRLQRKKTKLSNRAEARKKLDPFAQPVFETALHQDCISSEESDGEYVEGGEGGEKVQAFRTRGPSWRSARLLRYYAILDNHDRIEKSLKPKRGGLRVRREGPPKDGLFLPPKGVARWMVSRRWLQDTEAARPDLVETLRERIVDTEDQENEVTRVLLGAEDSEDEAIQGPPVPDVYAHISDTSYSLHNALQPV